MKSEDVKGKEDGNDRVTEQIVMRWETELNGIGNGEHTHERVN